MVPYLLLCLLAIGGVSVQGQVTTRECNACQFQFFSTCLFTTSYTAQCQENSFCGVTNYTLGGTIMFARYGCIETGSCNQTLQGTGILKSIFVNSTCCSTNYCNGGFTAQAPHLAVMGLISVVLLYITSWRRLFLWRLFMNKTYGDFRPLHLIRMDDGWGSNLEDIHSRWMIPPANKASCPYKSSPHILSLALPMGVFRFHVLKLNHCIMKSSNQLSNLLIFRPFLRFFVSHQWMGILLLTSRGWKPVQT